MRMLCPVSVSVYEPSRLNVFRDTAPLDIVDNVLPSERFVNLNAEPVPVSRLRTRIAILVPELPELPVPTKTLNLQIEGACGSGC